MSSGLIRFAVVSFHRRRGRGGLLRELRSGDPGDASRGPGASGSVRACRSASRKARRTAVVDNARAGRS